MYKSSYKLFEFLEDYKFGRVAKEEYNVVYNSIYDCDLLIIDDLGTEFSTALSVSDLFYCINQRILLQKATIISTNLGLSQISKVYSDRTFSRISGNYQLLKLFGPDLRLQF